MKTQMHWAGANFTLMMGNWVRVNSKNLMKEKLFLVEEENQRIMKFLLSQVFL